MKLWLCKHSEDIPTSEITRKFRVGMLADQLISENHDVTWWTSDYNHYSKLKLNLPIKTYNGVNLKVANVIPYEKNVSYQRIYNHHQIGKFFTKNANKETFLPDLIYASMPTLDFAYRATKYAKKNNIPMVVDIRDLWPDVFLDLVPVKALRNEKIFYLWNKKLEYILSNVTAITAITEEYLDWALKKASLAKDNKIHRVFPLGYEKVDTSNLDKTMDPRFSVTFIGTVGYHFDFETIFKAAEILEEDNILFNILGDGDLLADLKQRYGHLSNINFAGHVSGETLQIYLNNSDVGLAPYFNSKNFKLNIPNKPYEYLAYGMPILSPLEGPTERLILENNIGYKYEESNYAELAERIKVLKEDNILFNEMKKNCTDLFKSKYEKEKIYEEYVSFFKELINNN